GAGRCELLQFRPGHRAVARSALDVIPDRSSLLGRWSGLACGAASGHELAEDGLVDVGWGLRPEDALSALRASELGPSAFITLGHLMLARRTLEANHGRSPSWFRGDGAQSI